MLELAMVLPIVGLTDNSFRCLIGFDATEVRNEVFIFSPNV